MRSTHVVNTSSIHVCCCGRADEKEATYCAPTTIILGTTWWLKGYLDETGKSHSVWSRPDIALDTDSSTMALVEAIRKEVGLAPPLPFAPLKPQVITIASRDPKLREK